ncbi:SDR family NAD(P)-dependent oxidoreductase [Lactiplantibacillus garii]|uniref:SDR family NAD(P)-dependent oxidoreductase n=1 Tax=Lactiplantibacillus garii TaxID=2306423 RepID=A0A3R8J967_9LACO|nr:SDR family NAD(P)-dependent oxidoreductase [Lactiplantibacillus garii]RRK11210.1 SDR family NAD(P)-dependent oxidoreductase [Lactiplantibacillus garii]
MANLTGQTVLITGASSGLGEQLAFAVAARGANVVLAARRQERLTRVADQCRILSGAQAIAVQCDVSRVAAVDHLFATIDELFGRLDVVLNAAGFGAMVNAVAMDPALTAKMFRVNTLGVMYVSQLAAKRMVRQRRGEIVNVASIAGKIATPKSAVYAATKAALIAYDNALRLELKAAHVNVMTVNPGPIKTDFFKTADPSGQYLARVDKIALNPVKFAELIVSKLGHHRREINRPWVMAAANLGYQAVPRLGDWLAGSVFNFK